MPEFRSLNDLKKFLKNAVTEALKDEPPKVIKKVMREHIKKDVYDVYQPIEYQRRYDDTGGLYDEDMTISKNPNSYTVEVYNIAKRNINYMNRYLVPVIEYGHKKAESKGYKGYTYERPQYRYYYPRPFVKNTYLELVDSLEHVKAFQKSLKKYGIDSE